MSILIILIATSFYILLWHKRGDRKDLNLGGITLTLIGASIMWIVDGIFKIIKNGFYSFFRPSIDELVRDTLIGIIVVVIAVVFWFLSLLLKKHKEV